MGGGDLTSDKLGLMGEEILQDKLVTVTELQVLGNFINDFLYLDPPPRNIITTYQIPTRVHIFSIIYSWVKEIQRFRKFYGVFCCKTDLKYNFPQFSK